MGIFEKLFKQFSQLNFQDIDAPHLGSQCLDLQVNQVMVGANN